MLLMYFVLTPATIAYHKIRDIESSAFIDLDDARDKIQESFLAEVANVSSYRSCYCHYRLAENGELGASEVDRFKNELVQQLLMVSPENRVAATVFLNSHLFAVYREKIDNGYEWHLIDSLEDRAVRGCSQHYVFDSVDDLARYLLTCCRTTMALSPDAVKQKIVNDEHCSTVTLDVYTSPETDASSSKREAILICLVMAETKQKRAYIESLAREADKLESQDFKAEWAASLQRPIDFVGQRFGSLELCGRKVKVI